MTQMYISVSVDNLVNFYSHNQNDNFATLDFRIIFWYHWYITAYHCIARYNIPMSKKAKKYLTIKDVAKALDISERSVNRYIESKKLKATKIGAWRVMKKDLEDFI